MIEYVSGNILDSDAESLVNPVNCVGVMGAGLALQFKHEFPGNYKLYKIACDEGRIMLGSVFVTRAARTIINFPTKRHWKNKSQLKHIKLGLSDLRNVVDALHIKSVALPALGCGLGGLSWEEVRIAIVCYLGFWDSVEVMVYEHR